MGIYNKKGRIIAKIIYVVIAIFISIILTIFSMEAIKNVKELRERIIKGEINDYTVNTLTYLCGKAIEHFSQIGDEKYKEFMNIMKEVLSLDGVDKLTKENENEIKENSDI